MNFPRLEEQDTFKSTELVRAFGEFEDNLRPGIFSSKKFE